MEIWARTILSGKINIEKKKKKKKHYLNFISHLAHKNKGKFKRKCQSKQMYKLKNQTCKNDAELEYRQHILHS